jgi:hypothetical protein
MVTKVTSENILKLRALTEKISAENNNDDYKVIVKQLKSIVDGGKTLIEESKTPQSKIKCYETMCTTITNLLSNVKIV